MSDLEVRQLRYFVAVAEERNFGRAAARLGMAQPPLSRAIRALERQLGVALLERTTRQVTTTPAGDALLREGRRALDAVAAAEARTREAGRPVPVLRLALKADYDGGLLARALEAYRGEESAVPVELVMTGRHEQVPALRDGRADVALLPLPGDDPDLIRSQLAAAELDGVALVSEPRVLAVAATDPLAARPCLHLADLADRVLPDGTPAHLDRLPITEAPREPRTRPDDLAQLMSLVEIGSAVWFPPTSLARRHVRPDIAYRTVVDLPPMTLALAWPQDSRSATVAAFTRVVTSVAASADPQEIH